MNETQVNVPQEKQSDKELNFRALEAKYQKALDQERNARLEAERIAQEATSKKHVQQDDDDDDEPYVDKKKLNKKLASFGQNTQSEIQKAMEMAKETAKQEIRKESWMERNPDFYDVLQHAEKFAQEAPELAETILQMPEGFERQKLVYQNIKKLGIDKPQAKQQSIQDKVDANRKSPFYQPSGISTGPYSQAGDFSDAGKKNAYDKMKALQKQLRM